MKRRTFIKNTTLAATGSVLLSSLSACTMEKKKQLKSVGIQLYTLRDVIFKDLPGTLKKVADIGYTEVETFSYGDGKIFGQPFSDYIKLTNDFGLKTVSGHYLTGFNSQTLGNLQNGWEQAVADARAAGQEYMVIAYLVKEERQSIDQYKALCHTMNKAAEVCKNYGIKLGYHNHDFEFESLEGMIPYDVMLAELDPGLVCMELDLYWITRANYSPSEYFIKYPGRFELWHVKDMNREDRTKNADIGTGTINFVELFAQKKQSGMKHFFVEQETYPISSIDSAEKSFRYITEIL